MEELNAKPFKQLPGNRQQAFERLDQPALKPLPAHPYRFVDIKPVKVNIDYQVQYQQHHYSVRIREVLRLRVKDLEFAIQQQIVRDGKAKREDRVNI